VDQLPPAEGVAEVSTGEARHGRRDNGLVAAEYAAAGDVDPRVGEHLLDVLALDGIAAYLRPSTDLHPVTRSSTLPGRPTDRLYVDRVHLATARDYLTRLAEEPDTSPSTRAADTRPAGAATRTGAADTRPGATDVDAEWAKIVAGFDLEFDGPRGRWPEAEDLPEPGRSDLPGTTVLPVRGVPAPPPPRPDPEDLSLLDGLDTFGADLPDDDEEGYDPPPAPPVPRPSAPTALAVAGIVLGLILFLKPTLLPVAESLAMLTGFTAVVGGFATLVWRLRPGDDEDEDDPDQGAKV
jgi:hypothetical protein